MYPFNLGIDLHLKSTYMMLLDVRKGGYGAAK